MWIKMLAVAVLGFWMAGAAEGLVAVPLPRPVEPPAPPAGWVYRWVTPEYRRVTEWVWVEERREWVTECIEVRPGEWAEVRREVVRPAHWETRVRRELVRGGYWELVRVADEGRPVPMPRPVDRTVGVEGYVRSGSEDLSPFSGLKEWPK